MLHACCHAADYDGTPRAADSYRYGGGYYKLGRTLTGNLDFQVGDIHVIATM